MNYSFYDDHALEGVTLSSMQYQAVYYHYGGIIVEFILMPRLRCHVAYQYFVAFKVSQHEKRDPAFSIEWNHWYHIPGPQYY
jgi:hypothetical protein